MDSIKILIPIHTKPNIISDTTLLFGCLLPELRKKINVIIVWVVYQPNKIKTLKKYNEVILDFHDYENFIDLLQKEKPDLVYAAATYSIIDYAISSASRYLNIPVLSKIYSRLGIIKERKTMLKSMVSRVFEDNVPSDDEITKKQFMKRGRFFFYKFKYLIKTLNACKINKIKSLFIGLHILTYFLNIGRHEGYPEFANTLHWLEGESNLQKLIEMGYDKKSLVVTGNPIYDSVMKEIIKTKEEEKLETKILFLPIAFYEHGMWTKEQNENNFKSIINKINSSQTYSLKIKIHPSSNRFSEYKKMINEIDTNISLFQEGDAQKFIVDSDIVVSYASHSTALVFVLLNKKPLILCNFDNQEKGPLLEREIAIECNNPLELNSIIKNTLENNPISEEKINNFLKEFFYKLDGNASTRLANEILKITKKH
ncbi:MAG: hypothetical protein ACW9XH_00380 [Candidatus Nitrosopumilus sp. bin_32a]